MLVNVCSLQVGGTRAELRGIGQWSHNAHVVPFQVLLAQVARAHVPASPACTHVLLSCQTTSLAPSIACTVLVAPPSVTGALGLTEDGKWPLFSPGQPAPAY